MQQLLIMFHVLISVSLVALILLQRGRGADIGAAFGSGASQTVFGSQGSGSFLVKVTAGFAALFFITTLLLGYTTALQAKQMKAANALIPLQGTPAVLPAESTDTQPKK